MADVKISDLAPAAPASSDLIETEVSGVSKKSTCAEVFTAGKSAASEGATGVVELATLAEVSTGTSSSLAVTPEGVKQETDLCVKAATLNAETILYATVDDTPAALAVAASRIVGRKSTGSIIALTAAELRTILGTAPFVIGSDADGDTWYRASGALARVGKGTALQYYRMNSGATAPEWVTSVPGTGHLVQVQHAVINSVVTCNIVMPCDDTIPQKTDGTEVITCAITPQDASNILLIMADIACTFYVSTYYGGMALFQDTTTDALAAVQTVGAFGATNRTLTYSKVAGTVLATTFKIRVGPKSAGAIYINSQQDSSTRVFGGVSASTLTIFEYTP